MRDATRYKKHAARMMPMHSTPSRRNEEGTDAVRSSPGGQCVREQSCVHRFLCDLTGLLQLQGFSMVRLSAVTGIAEVGKLTHLQSLVLSGMQIESLSFLPNLANLTELGLIPMPIRSIVEVGNLRSLKTISIRELPVKDVTPLLQLPNLEKCDIKWTPAQKDVLDELKNRGVKID